jgi:DNA-binding MarR family transcriptional regulator
VIERRPDAADARISHVYLTSHGRTLLKPVIEVWNQAEERIVKGMTKSERALLRRLLLQVSANLSS